MGSNRKISIILPNDALEAHSTKMSNWNIMPYRRVDECLMSKPDRKLSEIITGYEQVNVVEDTTESATFYPTANTSLAFYCGPDTPFIYITGPMTRPIQFTDVKPGTYFVILFSPAKLFTVDEVPLNEFHNQWVPIENIPIHNFHTLSEQLSRASTFRERIMLWESHFYPGWFDKLRNVPFWVNEILTTVSKDPTNFDDKKLSKLTGYTVRRTRDIFRRYTGITPKDYRRILRYKLSLYNLTTNPRTNLAGLANNLGFFDQAHFVNDFKKFHGSTPTQFIEEFLNSSIKSLPL